MMQYGAEYTLGYHGIKNMPLHVLIKVLLIENDYQEAE
jgi:hypothetical protein